MAEVFDFGLQEHKIKMDGGFSNNGLFAVVGDTARRLEVQLLNSNNAIQDTTGINLRLNAEVAGKITFVDAVVKDSTKGIYTVNLSNGMFLEPGNWAFQWQITKGTNKISSFPFTVKIGQNISEGGAQATNFYFNVEELRLKTVELENRYQTMIDSTTGKDVISAPEIIAARKDKPNLNARLDTFEQSTTAQFQQNKTEGVKVGNNPSFGYFSVNRERTTLDFHAFEDWGILNATDTGQGYSSFDAKAMMKNDLPGDHFAGYQSRNIYSGSGGLSSYMHGYDVDMEHSGTGTIKNARGLYIKDIRGNGPVENDYGILVNEIKKGTLSNYNIASYGGKNIFTGSTEMNTVFSSEKQFLLDYGKDEIGKEIAIGYGLKGFANAGKIVMYNGKQDPLMFFDDEEITIYKGKLNFRLLTRDQLPAATEGAIGYCSNGLKPTETTGNGTGVPVYYSGGFWRSFHTNELVGA